MYYCSDCDIAYEEWECPLCATKAEIKALEQEIERLNNLE